MYLYLAGRCSIGGDRVIMSGLEGILHSVCRNTWVPMITGWAPTYICKSKAMTTIHPEQADIIACGQRFGNVCISIALGCLENRRDLVYMVTDCDCGVQGDGQQEQALHIHAWHGLLQHIPATCDPEKHSGESWMVHTVHSLPVRDRSGQVRVAQCTAMRRHPDSLQGIGLVFSEGLCMDKLQDSPLNHWVLFCGFILLHSRRFWDTCRFISRLGSIVCTRTPGRCHHTIRISPQPQASRSPEAWLCLSTRRARDESHTHRPLMNLARAETVPRVIVMQLHSIRLNTGDQA